MQTLITLSQKTSLHSSNENNIPLKKQEPINQNTDTCKKMKSQFEVAGSGCYLIGGNITELNRAIVFLLCTKME